MPQTPEHTESAETKPRTMHQNSLDNLEAHTEEARKAKLERQALVAQLIIDQFTTGKFQGVLPILRDAKIPVGTYLRWLNDKDFTELAEQIRQVKRVAMQDHVFRAIFTGKGAGTAGYALGVLNRIDPEYSDKLTHSGNVGTIQLVTSIRQPDRRIQADTLAGGEGEVERAVN